MLQISDMVRDAVIVFQFRFSSVSDPNPTHMA